MAKTLAQGRKPGSGRKPGKAKTLAQGRKPGSGRKKRQQQQRQQNNLINTIVHNDNNNNNSDNRTLNLSQNRLTVNSISLQSNDLPTNNNNNNSNKSNGGGTNNNLNEKLDINSNSLSTRDMVAADALRELTQSPLSLTSNNTNNQNSHNNNNNISSTISNPAIIDNLMLPPLNEIVNYTDPINPTDVHDHNHNNNNSNNSALQGINSNDPIISPLSNSEVSTIPFTNKLNNNNSNNNPGYTSASVPAQKNSV